MKSYQNYHFKEQNLTLNKIYVVKDNLLGAKRITVILTVL